MNIRKMCLLLAASACVFPVVRAQMVNGRSSTSPPEQILREATSETGSLLRRQVAWSSKIPLNRTYEQLTPEQKQSFHAMYESIAPGDEPPFPLEGMKPIVNAIVKAQSKLNAHGELQLAVTVDATGKARRVEAYGEVDEPELTKFAASVLLLTKFKPAVCAGAPCAMQFPFNLKLRSGP